MGGGGGEGGARGVVRFPGIAPFFGAVIEGPRGAVNSRPTAAGERDRESKEGLKPSVSSLVQMHVSILINPLTG